MRPAHRNPQWTNNQDDAAGRAVGPVGSVLVCSRPHFQQKQPQWPHRGLFAGKPLDQLCSLRTILYFFLFLSLSFQNVTCIFGFQRGGIRGRSPIIHQFLLWGEIIERKHPPHIKTCPIPDKPRHNIVSDLLLLDVK